MDVQVHDIKIGTGDEIKKGYTAEIGYVGKLDDGTVFDQGKYTFTFGKGQVSSWRSRVLLNTLRHTMRVQIVLSGLESLMVAAVKATPMHLEKARGAV